MSRIALAKEVSPGVYVAQRRQGVAQLRCGPCCGGGGGGPGCACCELQERCAWEKCYGDTTRMSISMGVSKARTTFTEYRGSDQNNYIGVPIPGFNISAVHDFPITNCSAVHEAQDENVRLNAGAFGSCRDAIVGGSWLVASEIHFDRRFIDRENQERCNFVLGQSSIHAQAVSLYAYVPYTLWEVDCDPDVQQFIMDSFAVTMRVWGDLHNGTLIGDIRLEEERWVNCERGQPSDPLQYLSGGLTASMPGGVCGGILRAEGEIQLDIPAGVISPSHPGVSLGLAILAQVSWETGDCEGSDLEPLFPGQATPGLPGA